MGSHRQARREAAPTGSCLALWKRSDVRAALWEVRQGRASARPEARRGCGRTEHDAPRPVSVTHDADYAAWVVGEGARKRALAAASNPRVESNDPLVAQWVVLVGNELRGKELRFFTGTYSDSYGMSHGCMLPRNVQADFKRALKSAGLDDAAFICAVEPHRDRAVLHLHALVEASEADARVLQHVWAERGWSSAPAVTDGGLSYCCKYALKSSTPDSFEWRWS